MPNDYDHILINLAHKDCLNNFQLAKAAIAIKLAHDLHPDAELSFAIDGYDDDPRELYEIPEAHKFIQDFAWASGLRDWKCTMFNRLCEDSKAVLLACDAVAKPHPYKLELPDTPAPQAPPSTIL